MQIIKPSGDVTKLPHWAQQHIRALETACQSASDELAQMTGDEETPITYQVNLDAPRPIPLKASVRFRVGEFSDDLITINLQAEQGRPILVVGAHTRKLVIEPTASNRIVLKTSQE